jgi:hypothetical protein
MNNRSRLNNPDICFMCGCRSDNVAVGRPGQLGWFCLTCGIDRGLEAIKMPKQLDIIEQRALKRVADNLPKDQFNFPPEELPLFVKWVIADFGDAIRAEIESGKAPF